MIISNLYIFGRYYYIYYRDTRKEGLSYPTESLGRCLYPVDYAGNTMSGWVLNDNDKVLSCQILWRLTQVELNNHTKQKTCAEFDTPITFWVGNSIVTYFAVPPSISSYY